MCSNRRRTPRHRLLGVSLALLTGVVLLSPSASARPLPGGCAALTESTRDTCTVSSALGVTLAVPLRVAVLTAHTGALRTLPSDPAVSAARGQARGTLDGTTFQGTPILAAGLPDGPGAYWTPVDTNAAYLAGTPTQPVLARARYLGVEFSTGRDGVVHLSEQDTSYFCPVPVAPPLGGCNQPEHVFSASFIGAPVTWRASGRGLTRTLHLDAPVSVTDTTYTPVPVGDRAYTLQEKGEYGRWVIDAHLEGSQWVITSTWSTHAHGSHTSHVTAHLTADGSLQAASS